MKKTILSICLLAFYACGNHSGNREADNKYTVEGEFITIPENAPLLQKIKVEKIATTDYPATFTASGTVQAIPAKYAEIATPFAGRIVKSFVHIGQKVSPGSPVFELSSPSFFETAKAYYQAKQEMELAQKNLNRERDLLANHVGVAKDVEEAEVNYELHKKDYENQLAAMKVYQIDPDKGTLGQPLIVRSPIAGEVVRENILIGQYIKEDAEALALVADLSKVWFTAQIKEKDIHLLQNIAGVQIRLNALPEALVTGAIHHISKLVDEETRSVEVIIECDNKEHQLMPNMYGSVEFTDAPIRAVTIPNAAVLQNEDRRYVLISEGKNRFRESTITVAGSDEKQTVVLSGINEGDSVLTEGAFYFIEAK